MEALIGFTIALVAAENVGVKAGASRAIAVIAGVGLACLLLLRVSTGIGLPVITSTGLVLFAVCYLQLSDTQVAAARHRPVLTVLFGLIHGFGFARVLMEIGLPQGRMAGALFGFN
ncbi:MAG: HupE/UreJ family protein, partial [bacterium]|nr:HupE/UreJ family protein [bacterium]